MPANTDTFTGDIAAAVRAEMARRKRPLKDLIGPLKLSWPTVSSRVNGQTSFTADELERVAEFLDFPDAYGLIAAAEKSKTTQPAVQPVARITPPADPWAQPARSGSRRRA